MNWLLANRGARLGSAGQAERHMDTHDYNSHCKPLIGLTLRSIEKRDFTWFFVFSDEISIHTEDAWRFLDADRIVVTSEDHGHQFGLPTPVDSAERVLAGTSRKPVAAAAIARPTGDLIVDFGGQVRLQFLQMSCGYESWRLNIRGGLTICCGGGNIVHEKGPSA